jgi:hypothetical protein
LVDHCDRGFILPLAISKTGKMLALVGKMYSGQRKQNEIRK